MKVLSVPNELSTKCYPYPRYNVEAGVEDTCSCFIESHEVKSNRVYLPIHWWNNYIWQNRATGEDFYRSLNLAQQFIDGLDTTIQYVTVCWGSGGIYEKIPSNLDLTIFCAGGAGDIPLPQIMGPPFKQKQSRRIDRHLVASFLGNIWQSVEVRKAMATAFNRSKTRFVVRHSNRLRNPAVYVQEFCSLMEKSKYALAPRGCGPTSFRLYEAMELGCVPVYIYDRPWIPYQDVLDWNEFCVLCPLEELFDLPDRLISISEQWYTNAIQTIEKLLPQYFSLEGVATQLKRMIEQLDVGITK